MANKALTQSEHDGICLRHDKELNRNGCEYGRSDAEKLNVLELEYKSDLISVKAGQKLFVEDIFPKMKDSVRDAKDLTLRAETAASKAAKDVNWLTWMIVLAVISQISLGAMKLFQDFNNQKQLMECLVKISYERGIK